MEIMNVVDEVAMVLNNYIWILNIVGLILAGFLAIRSVVIPFTSSGTLLSKLAQIALTVVFDFIIDSVMIVANTLNVYYVLMHPEDPSMGIWWAIGWFCLWAFVLMPARAGLKLFGIG